jgi:LAO/AO transport system kinase
LILEAAGYDIIIVETVGVGQSEVAVANMTDMFILMQLPNAGDELQAIKKGVMELADLVLINKADCDPVAATRAQAQFTSSLRLMSQHGNPETAHHRESVWHPKAMQLSALVGTGLESFWHEVQSFEALQKSNGAWLAKRKRQNLHWLDERLQSMLLGTFHSHPRVKQLYPEFQLRIAQGNLSVSSAVQQLMHLYQE